MLRATAALDYVTRFVLPLCSAMSDRPNPSEPVTSAVFLVDIASFSFKQAWNVRGYAQDISRLLATCYPETVDRVYVSAHKRQDRQYVRSQNANLRWRSSTLPPPSLRFGAC